MYVRRVEFQIYSWQIANLHYIMLVKLLHWNDTTSENFRLSQAITY
jgi:hypothetical protein